ncbi:hypothetical protein PCE1_000258 [Barthelona sp. PCE]
MPKNATKRIDNENNATEVLDYSFFDMPQLQPPPDNSIQIPSSRAVGWLLNNNLFEELDSETLRSEASAAFTEGPEQVKFIDLSFNKLEALPDFSVFPNLISLALQGNQIKSVGVLINAVKNCTKLKRLSVAYNPVEEHRNYKVGCLAYVPSLNHFDGSPVFANDHHAAKDWLRRRQNIKAQREDVQ